MAERPFFVVMDNGPLWIERTAEFHFYSGFAISQKQKCIQSLHESIGKLYTNKEILEISTKSTNPDGVKLSAFNLKISHSSGKHFYLENCFQSGKIFENGGPYVDLLEVNPREAKKDERLKNSGLLKAFTYDGKCFETYPKTMFYDWLYINAVNENDELRKNIVKYDIFTDIEFNPAKSINCQARSAAICASLIKRGLLEEALKSEKAFRKIVYGEDKSSIQMSFFE